MQFSETHPDEISSDEMYSGEANPDQTHSGEANPDETHFGENYPDEAHSGKTDLGDLSATETATSAAAEPDAVEERSADFVTLDLAIRDARAVLDQQQQLRQFSLTQLNILFVVNTALLTILSISRLIFTLSWFSLLEISGFLLSFSLLIYALLPRQLLVTPNLEDRESLERYLALSPDDYRLQMLTNLVEVYNANKQRLDDITQALLLASYALWATVIMTLLHILIAVLSVAHLLPFAV